MKRLPWIIAGALAGIVFVLACERADTGGTGGGTSAGTTASAAPSDCAQWEVQNVNTGVLPDSTESADGKNKAKLIPKGWEPFAYYGAGDYQVRKCAP